MLLASRRACGGMSVLITTWAGRHIQSGGSSMLGRLFFETGHEETYRTANQFPSANKTTNLSSAAASSCSTTQMAHHAQHPVVAITSGETTLIFLQAYKTRVPVVHDLSSPPSPQSSSTTTTKPQHSAAKTQSLAFSVSVSLWPPKQQSPSSARARTSARISSRRAQAPLARRSTWRSSS